MTCDQDNRLSWDDLHPALPPPVSAEQAMRHHETRQKIAAMPRNIFGIAILRALGMRLPNPPRKPQTVTREMVEESNRRIQQMRDELAAKGLTVTGRPESQPEIQQLPSRVEELRDSVVRSEAQTAFEAHMRASQLRGTLKA